MIHLLNIYANRIKINRISDHPNKCYISDNLIMSPGDEVKDPHQDCGIIRCQENSLAILES